MTTDNTQVSVGRIGLAALMAILIELQTSPKPGLVGPESSGGHPDMDISTFLSSTAAIAPYLFLVSRESFSSNLNDSSLLVKIRRIGQKAEKAMFTATDGVNTQKGTIFLQTLICAAAGKLARSGGKLKASEICDRVALLAGQTAGSELLALRSHSGESLTHGEHAFLKYGLKGIRGEVEGGLPTVTKVGLPSLEDALKNCFSLNQACLHTLLSLIAVTDDTNIAFRHGLATLREVQDICRRTITSGKTLRHEEWKRIHFLCQAFAERKIHPGGAADLLGATLTVHLLEQIQATPPSALSSPVRRQFHIVTNHP